MMCQGDATDCLVDGRNHSSKYFANLAGTHPEQPLYAGIAAQFGIVFKTVHENIFTLLGGPWRNTGQIEKPEHPETRRKLAELIDTMKTADEKALALMKQLVF